MGAGGWLPADEGVVGEYRRALAKRVCERDRRALTPEVVELAALCHNDPVVRMYLTEAIAEATRYLEEQGWGELGYSTIDELMALIDEVVTESIPYDETWSVGVPLYALVQWPMRMPAGLALFRVERFNHSLKGVLNAWCRFLSGPDSREYLNEEPPSGWFSPAPLAKLDMEEFVCHPKLPYWGYCSWNDFFTRHFKRGARPVAGVGDAKLIVNACEATPYNIQWDTRLQDTFWIKAQPYSLQDIFTAPKRRWARRFVGGSVYQAYLSQFNYHRWHAPISGRVVEAYRVEGTYYSDADAQALEPVGPLASQGYMSSVAARAVIIIESDDPVIGCVGCIFVGMAEISSCIIGRRVGEWVEKGEELGYFQYGGSTYCLVFQPGAIESFVPQPPFDDDETLLKLNSQLATAN